MYFAYLTDLHLGATEEGYHLQPRWIGGEPMLIDHLARKLQAFPIEAIVVGGDLVDRTDPDLIRLSLQFLDDLGYPTLVCLGNHDLTEPDAFPLWQEQVKVFKNIRLADAHMELDGGDLYALNNHWITSEGPRLYWPPGTHNIPHLMEAQLDWLDRQLRRRPDRPALLAVHAPLDGLPLDQTGDPLFAHQPPATYVDPLRKLLDAHAQVRVVTTGHCHATSAWRHGGRLHLATAAFDELPFQFRVIEIRHGAVTVATEPVAPGPDGLALDQARAWATGRVEDRRVILSITA